MDRIPNLLRADLERIEDPKARSLIVLALEQARDGLKDGVASRNSVVSQVRDQVSKKLNALVERQVSNE